MAQKQASFKLALASQQQPTNWAGVFASIAEELQAIGVPRRRV